MSRPLIISDCDEVLLYMVSPFRDWLAETQGVEFRMEGNDFGSALRWQDSGEVLPQEEIWRKLGGFFDTEMHRQTAIPGAIEGLNELADHADVVVLTNLVDKRQEMRREQLADHGLEARVFTNQGPKGPALQAILDEINDDMESDMQADDDDEVSMQKLDADPTFSQFFVSPSPTTALEKTYTLS